MIAKRNENTDEFSVYLLMLPDCLGIGLKYYTNTMVASSEQLQIRLEVYN